MIDNGLQVEYQVQPTHIFYLLKDISIEGGKTRALMNRYEFAK